MLNDTWSSMDNVYCEEECATNLDGIIDFVTTLELRFESINVNFSAK